MQISNAAKQSILFVEDDALILAFLQRFFARSLDAQRYDLQYTSTATAALAASQQHQFDLVITDYMLPDMNGLQLATAIRQHSPTTHVVLMSGLASPELAQQAQALGIDAMIAKPFLPAQLRGLIDNLLDTPDAPEGAQP